IRPMDGDEQSPDQRPNIPDTRDNVGCRRNQTRLVGPHFGGARMFLSMIPNEAENTRYLERTAQRLRSMTAHTTALEDADPAEVRSRLKARDRYARRHAGASQSVA
ncbi:MAG: hypothetical protein WBO84_00185, partial [Acidimicrobiia bacterium]